MNDKDKALCQRIAIQGADTELALEMGLKVHGEDKLVELLTEYIHQFVLQAITTSRLYGKRSKTHEIDRGLPSFTLFGFTFTGIVFFKNVFKSVPTGGFYEMLKPTACAFSALYTYEGSLENDFMFEGRNFVLLPNLRTKIDEIVKIALKWKLNEQRKREQSTD